MGIAGSIEALVQPLIEGDLADVRHHGPCSAVASILCGLVCVVLLTFGLVYPIMVFWYAALSI